MENTIIFSSAKKKKAYLPVDTKGRLGKLLWQKNIAKSGFSSPLAIDSDGNLVFCYNTRELDSMISVKHIMKLTPDKGKTVLEHICGYLSQWSEAVDLCGVLDNGNIIVTDIYNVFCISSQGEFLWKNDNNRYSISTHVISKEGLLFAAGIHTKDDEQVSCISPEGGTLWRFKTDKQVKCALYDEREEILYAHYWQKEKPTMQLKISKTGEILEEKIAIHFPIIHKEGDIFITYGMQMNVMDKKGTLLYPGYYPPEYCVFYPERLYSLGRKENGYAELFCKDMRTGKDLWRVDAEGALFNLASVLGTNNYIYILTNTGRDGCLQIFDRENGKLTDERVIEKCRLPSGIICDRHNRIFIVFRINDTYPSRYRILCYQGA